MALKTKEITIEKGRDAGTKFLITEMPVAKADNWAMRALGVLARSGIETPDANTGLVGVAQMGMSAFSQVKTEEVIPLLDELLDCVQIIPEGGQPRPLDLNINDVQDFTTLWALRKEVLHLHIDFLQGVLTQI